MKAIMMSIRPQYVAKILNGEKTIEIRRQFPKDYVGWVYIYCTKDKNNCVIADLQPDKVYHPLTELLHRGVYSIVEEDLIYNDSKKYILNGKVVARFWCDKVGNFSKEIFGTYEEPFTYNQDDLLKKSCLTEKELDIYLQGKKGYAIHVKPNSLEIFDEPKEIKEFKQEYNYFLKNKTCSGCPCLNCEENGCCLVKKPLTRAPQSWYYIEI